VTIDGTGKIIKYGNVTIGTAKLFEGQTGSNWILGRFADGTVIQGNETQMLPANGGIAFGYAIALPTTIPTTGSARYGILASTTPQFADASTTTSAALTGGFAIAFGASPKFGAEGIITLTNAGAQRYEFITPGGLAAPSLALNSFGGTIEAFGNTAITTSDTRCGSSCKIFFNLAGGGTALDVIAGTYTVAQQPSGGTFTSIFSGAVVATAATPVGAVPTPAVAAGPALGAGNQVMVTYGPVGFREAGIAVDADSSGRLASSSNATLAFGRGTTTDHENGSVAGIIGWTRWAGGTTTAAPADRPDLVKTISETGGGGMVWGTPATAVPTSGVASYDMIGKTAVVVNDGAAPLGEVSFASLRIDFATLRAGFEAGVNGNGQTYTIASAGGTGSPSMAIAQGQFASRGDGSVIGNGCTPTTCSVRVNGFLAGEGASHAGVAFVFSGGPPPGAPTLVGAVAFGKRP